MSKSLGNLVFVDQLRKEWDPAAIRLGHHRAPLPHEWEWDEELMPPGRRPARALAGRRGEPAAATATCSTRCATRLDDDLDTPGALAAIDAAAAEARGRAASRRGGAARRRRCDARPRTDRSARSTADAGSPLGTACGRGRELPSKWTA